MKVILCSLTILLYTHFSWACLNRSGTKYGGGNGSYIGGWPGLRAALATSLAHDGVEMESQLRGSTNFNDRSDYAVALMYLGRSTEAVDLLSNLEREQPGHFFIAANLGTAFELSGNNTEALHWIKEGIRRNPMDHNGTEWLHVKILEAKIHQEQDHSYFEKHSVLELQPGDIKDEIAVGNLKMSPKDLANAIQYQLRERLQFVKPPDAAVASLLYDYAAIEAATRSMESAKHILKMAADFGYPQARVQTLQSKFDQRLKWYHIRKSGLIILAVAAIAAVLMRSRFLVVSRKRT
ncbi:MAG TPA: hypothetical protein VFW05_13275 [Verrucomicrobiae bacterium]|nr:hypothetical protein [Verrucomicrobiae bacterium]